MCTKNIDWPQWQACRELNLQYLSEYCSFLIPNEHCYCFNHKLMMQCSDPQGTEYHCALLPERSWAWIYDISKLQLLVKKIAQPFQTCQLLLLAPSTSIEDGRKRVHFTVKKCEFIVFFQFSYWTWMKFHMCFMLSFLIQLQICNNQLSKVSPLSYSAVSLSMAISTVCGVYAGSIEDQKGCCALLNGGVLWQKLQHSSRPTVTGAVNVCVHL